MYCDSGSTAFCCAESLAAGTERRRPARLFRFRRAATALNGGPAPNNLNAYAAFPARAAQSDAEGRPVHPDDRPRVAVRLVRSGSLAGDPQADGQPRPALRIFPADDTRRRKGSGAARSGNQLVYLGGRGNVPVDNGITVSKKLFAPRIGIAYRLSEKTVIRTGYGLNYDPLPFSRPLRGFYPLTINNVYNSAEFVLRP